jgi:NAD(P)-dependent dehydrogenase (short-subunit alcohol dehydrogenase family)
MTIQGKYALITGSSRGIGRGIALKLAEQGVKIAINYYQNEALQKTRSRKYAIGVQTALWFKQTSAVRKRSTGCSSR